MTTMENAANDEGFLADLISRVSSSDVVDKIVPKAFKKVNDEMYVCNTQIDSTLVKDVTDMGIKTLFNLREATEEGFEDFPKDLPAGIATVHFPVPDNMEWPEASVDALLTKLDTCAKPFLVYCKTGARAAAIGVALESTRSRFHEGKVLWERTESLTDVQKSLLKSVTEGRPEDESQMTRFIKEYVSKKISNASARPGMSKVRDDMWIAGQLSEEEFKQVKEEGIVCVLCMRALEEAGQFGIGVLAREEGIIKELGMEWRYCPVPRDGPYSAELCAQVLEAVKTAPRPVLIHCRTGRRVKEVLEQAGGVPN